MHSKICAQFWCSIHVKTGIAPRGETQNSELTSTCVYTSPDGYRWCFFFADTFRSFSSRHILIICLTFALKLAVTVCMSLYFQRFLPKWLNEKKSRSITEKKRFGVNLQTLKYSLEWQNAKSSIVIKQIIEKTINFYWRLHVRLWEGKWWQSRMLSLWETSGTRAYGNLDIS